METEALTSVPAWGIFAVIVVKMALDFIDKLNGKRSRVSDRPPPPAATAEQIEAILLNQREREALVHALQNNRDLASQVIRALGVMADNQAQQTAIMERLERDHRTINAKLDTLLDERRV